MKHYQGSPWKLLAWLFVIALAWLVVCVYFAQAGPEWAVVRISSHGGSGTVVYSTTGKTHILTAAHMFEGRDRSRVVTIDAPSPNPLTTTAISARVVAVDSSLDLALVEVLAGPWPYVCPIAPARSVHRHLISVGYDDMHWPATNRPVTILREDGPRTLTHERPWHGRSGGGLIDADSGQLVGVVSALSGPNTHQEVFPGGFGIYASHGAILRFVRWPDNWDGSLRPVPGPNRPGAPHVFEQRECPGGTCPPGR